MKKIKLLTVAVLIAASFAVTTSFITMKMNQVKHVVVFRYKESASEAQIKEVTDAFRDLKNKIPGIVNFETGVNNSPEKLNKGFTHVYLLTFEDAAARDKYLPHAEHKKFGELLKKVGILEEAFVVDFEAHQ